MNKIHSLHRRLEATLACGLWLSAAFLAAAGNAQAQYHVSRGKGYTFCEAIASAINKVTPPDQPAACMSKPIFSVKGVTQPEWRELKPDEYDPEKIKQIYINHLIGEQIVMDKRLNPTQVIPANVYPHVDDVERFVRQLREGKVKLRTTKVDFVISPEPGLQTVLQLWWDYSDSDGCVRATPIFVKPDFSDFDDKAYRAASSIKSGFLVNYFGKPHLINTGFGDSATISRRGPDTFCEVVPNLHNLIKGRMK